MKLLNSIEYINTSTIRLEFNYPLSLSDKSADDYDMVISLRVKGISYKIDSIVAVDPNGTESKSWNVTYSPKKTIREDEVVVVIETRKPQGLTKKVKKAKKTTTKAVKKTSKKK